MKPGCSERNIGKTVYLSWPLQIVSGRTASSGGDNCHLHNLMAIYDICFSLAAGRNAAQAVIAGKTMLHRTANCRKEHKNQDAFHKAKTEAVILVVPCSLIFKIFFNCAQNVDVSFS